MRLAGKVAIITGGAKGIGRATALALAHEGAAVVVADIDQAGAQSTAGEITRLKGKAIAIETDVSRSDSVRRLVERTVAAFGRIDILVNNAAIINYVPLLDLTEQEWDRVMSVNLKGTLFCSQQVARVMLQHGGGAIVNLSSIGADHPTPASIHYGVSKVGLVHLTKSFALALGKNGIRVNAVAPGTIRTSMNEATLQQPGVEEEKLKVIALDHIGHPEEVADAIVFLASDEARYVTGAVLHVDGGALLLR